MKKLRLLSLIGLALTAAAFTDPGNTILGHWQQKIPKSGIATANFRSNGTYDGYVNGKHFVSGKYTVRQDTFALDDPRCGTGYYGTYKLAFITPDSVRFTVIQDTCRARRGSTGQSRWGRVMAGQLNTPKP